MSTNHHSKEHTMSADFESGMFIKEPAWHQDGNVLPAYVKTWKDACTAADLTFQPIALPVFDENGDVVPGWQRIVRSDSRKVLTVQTDTYAVIDHDELGRLIDYVMDKAPKELGVPKWDALVVLKEGKIVTCTVRLEHDTHILGDRSAFHTYIVFTARHDGRGGLQINVVDVRVVCANTQQMAEDAAAAAGLQYTIKHTKNWQQKLDQVKRSLQTSVEGLVDWREVAAELAGQKVSRAMFEDFLDQWMPISTAMTTRERTNMLTRRGQMEHLFFESEANLMIEQTKWRLLQSAYEWADHVKPARSVDTRVARQLIVGDPDKASALRLVKTLAVV